MDRLFWALDIPELECQVRGNIIITRIDTPYVNPPITVSVRYWQFCRLIHASFFVYPHTDWWNAVTRVAEAHMPYDESSRELATWMSMFSPRCNE